MPMVALAFLRVRRQGRLSGCRWPGGLGDERPPEKWGSCGGGPKRVLVGFLWGTPKAPVPGIQPHARLEPGAPGPEGSGFGLAAADLVGEDELEEVGVGHLLLPGQGEPIGQGVEHLAELERPQRGAQVRADRIAAGMPYVMT
jgi:hypothetical protein